MEGLEISEVNYSEVQTDNSAFRFDAQYFQKKYLIEDERRNKYLNQALGKIAFVTDGQHGYHEVDELSEIRHITAKNAKGWFANDDGADRIAKWVDEKNKRSSLQVNDLIFSTRGTVGLCAIVNGNILPANIDQDVARICVDESLYKPAVLLAYLNSKFGQDWVIRNSTGMIQQGIALWRLKEMPVPMFNNIVQNKIHELIQKAREKQASSQKTYSYAENILLEQLGLGNFMPNAEKVNIKSFKKSYVVTGRLDAEYYQLKYEQYEQHIKNYKNGFSSVADEYDLINNISDKTKPTYNYIEIGDVNVSAGEARFNRIALEDLPANAKYEVKRGDVIISKVRPNRGAVAIIDFEDTDLIVSGAFTVLRKKTNSIFSAETLKTLLRTKVFRDWLLKFNIGSQYPVIKDEDILNLPIPKIEEDVHTSISVSAQKCFVLKSESQRLLEISKQAIEIAIEENEDKALIYISKQLKS